MKLDYDSLKAVKPDIILTTVSAYGSGGPYSDRVGFDGIGQVMSGAVYMTGTEDQPYRAQVPWVDFGTALHCAFGTMAALMARKATGKGQWVQGALLATAVTFGNALLIEQARDPGQPRADRQPRPDLGPGRHLPHQGRLDPVPGGRQPAVQALGQADGRGALAHRSALQGRHLARRQRRRHRERMGRWCAERTSADALEILGAAKIPAGPVLKPQQTLDDPHIKAMGFFQPTEFPGAPRPAPLAKVPVWLSETPGSIRHRAPDAGRAHRPDPRRAGLRPRRPSPRCARSASSSGPDILETKPQAAWRHRCSVATS